MTELQTANKIVDKYRQTCYKEQQRQERPPTVFIWGLGIGFSSGVLWSVLMGWIF